MPAADDNVVDFPRVKLPPRGDKEATFEAYESVIRADIQGDVGDAGFQDWIVAAALARDLVGWVREHTGEGRMDAVLAGTRDGVAGLIAALREGDQPETAPRAGACPITAPEVTERPLRGDEPLWSGFHRLPPV